MLQGSSFFTLYSRMETESRGRNLIVKTFTDKYIQNHFFGDFSNLDGNQKDRLTLWHRVPPAWSVTDCAQIPLEYFSHWCPFSSSYKYDGWKCNPVLLKQSQLLPAHHVLTLNYTCLPSRVKEAEGNELLSFLLFSLLFPQGEERSSGIGGWSHWRGQEE